jgi:hypothetical protein
MKPKADHTRWTLVRGDLDGPSHPAGVDPIGQYVGLPVEVHIEWKRSSGLTLRLSDRRGFRTSLRARSVRLQSDMVTANGRQYMPTDPFNEGRVAALIHGRRELNPYKSNPAGESIYIEYASAWDSGFRSVATTRAREGSATTECEEKTADNIRVMPGSSLDEIREYVQRTMPGESVAVIDSVTQELWRNALKAETDSQRRPDENFSTRRPGLEIRQRPAGRGLLRALARRGLRGRRSHS